MSCIEMDLMGGYLLIALVLFTANISLFAGNLKISNAKLILLSCIAFIASFVLMNISSYLGSASSLLMDNFSYFFIVLAILLFLTFICYFRKNDLKFALVSVIMLAVISVAFLSSQSNLQLFDSLLYSLFSFLAMFFVYQLTKLLVHAKRDYPVIIGEYMCLFSLLLFLFGLTYDSTRSLNYTMFSPFLILTPTYQLIYVIIGIIVVLVIGVVYNDNIGGNS